MCWNKNSNNKCETKAKYKPNEKNKQEHCSQARPTA